MQNNDIFPVIVISFWSFTIFNLYNFSSFAFHTHSSHLGCSGFILKLSSGKTLRCWTSNRPPMMKSPSWYIPFNLKCPWLWQKS